MRLSTVVAILVAAGCAESAPVIAPDERVDGCPGPGAGTTIGGLEGTGRDATPSPVRRLVLMGGGPEDDGAARRFAEAAAGGDIVVLRATGSLTSYPDYFSGELAPSPLPASVVTIRTDTPPLAEHPGVLCRVNRAEAIWLAGGSQWDYLGRWPHAVHVTVREATLRGAALGGTSAGAVSLGEAAFDARHGTITSAEALSDPADVSVSVGPSNMPQPELANTIVDSHFTERSREGRLLAFLGRLLALHRSGSFVGIGLDEGTALEVEGDGYRVFSSRGGAVWMYEATGPAVVQPGRPLSLDGIRRVRLVNGSSGRWPFSFDEAEGVQRLVVEEGAVRVEESSRSRCYDVLEYDESYAGTRRHAGSLLGACAPEKSLRTCFPPYGRPEARMIPYMVSESPAIFAGVVMDPATDVHSVVVARFTLPSRSNP